MSIIENNLIIIICILKQKRILRNLIFLFGNTIGTPFYRLQAITIQRKQKLPSSLKFKPGGSVEFWPNFSNGVFKAAETEI